MLDIVVSYHRMQFPRKLMNQTWKNGKKPIFGPNWGPFGLKFWPPNFFVKNLAPSVITYYDQLSSCTISEKLMIQSWENLVKDGRTDRRTRVISSDAVRLTSSVQIIKNIMTDSIVKKPWIEDGVPKKFESSYEPFRLLCKSHVGKLDRSNLEIIASLENKIWLTHLFPMHPFFTTWKHQKTLRFFRG